VKPNLKKIKGLVDKKFSGNKSAFASAIGVDRAQVSKLLKDGSGAGAQFFGGLMAYCEKEDLKFADYIFLPKGVKKVNKKHSA
jgi:uncharacterized protein with von Willebrand factor type A (vWA) domain